MLLPLLALAALRPTTLSATRQGGMIGSHPPAFETFYPGVDHRPLLAMMDQGVMLAPDRERWAVAVLDAVGTAREQAYPDGGRWDVFDVDLRVLDGWHVAKGTLRAFWNEDSSHRRIPLLRGMVGSRVLIRLAPTENGRSLILSGTDDEIEIGRTFAVGSRPLLSLLLPTEATALEGGTPAERRFHSLWRAARSLSISTYEYPGFRCYISPVDPPLTSRVPRTEVRGTHGIALDDGHPPQADVRWLRSLARESSPAFALFVEMVLRSQHVLGWPAEMRAAVRRALRDPALVPDGLFLDTFAPKEIPAGDDPDWPPVAASVSVLARRPNVRLTRELLDLIGRAGVPVPDRARLLPLLNDADPGVRRAAAGAFAAWHGAPPKDADPFAWHAARARLSPKELEAAKAGATG